MKTTADLNKIKLFDRELSWIEFNARVLAEATDNSNPILERLKFMGIVSSNFDEFFMVRVSSLIESDSNYKEVYSRAFQLIDTQNSYFQETLVQELNQSGISRVHPPALNQRQREFVESFFYKELMPLLTPIAVREDQPAPEFVNLSLYLVVQLRGTAESGHAQFAVVEIPKNYPRLLSIPVDRGYEFILLEDVAALFAAELFQGYEIENTGLLRVTRAAEMTLNEERDEDFSKVMSEALHRRERNYTVRLEMSGSGEMTGYFKKKLNVPDERVYQAGEWMDLKGVSQLAFQPMFDVLKRPKWEPRVQADFEAEENVWDAIKNKDILVHHPYESFDCIVRFLNEAADDPEVLAIKQTLYRVAEPSAVISALERAAENGKQVTVLVELKARFDEERNIGWAHRLVNAGATVLYGVAGYKTHAKACLVIRREAEGIRRYVHLGTGNYNEKTALLYSDLGIFTCDEEMAQDISSFFNVITGFSRPVEFSKIEIAPYSMRLRIERMIEREIMRHSPGNPGLILLKMNSLADPNIINLLYLASKAGVKVKLNIRGICRLVPGVKGLSENIKVVSIVDMFLEHSRIFYFRNGGDEEIYLSSADWMPRNLDRRLEILFPVENNKIKKTLHDLLKGYFKDNTKAWVLLPSGEYQKKEPGKEKKFRIQEYLCRKAAEAESALKNNPVKDLKPQRAKKLK